jgi:hypothetical protein
MITVLITAAAIIPYTWWLGSQTSRSTQYDHLPKCTFCHEDNPRLYTVSLTATVYRASSRRAER